MRAGRKKQTLTEKEAVIMNMLWEHGPLFVREMLELYPEPKPHFNTISTTVRILESKGYVTHEVFGASHRFEAVAQKANFRSRSLADVVRDYFGNSYKSAVSALVEEEKISVDELKEIVDLIESKNRNNNSKD
ncbi:MAG: BlaI/MecI/CopY family transcriptional regulator [Muribaculaceae bacterium]|nr:BlaI/MecI/CopY family transcriptional regulator [Muribaculaceae bacterium]